MLESAGRLAAAISEHPREFVAIVMSTIAVFGIVTNALFLQKGPHPAPIFATRPLLRPQETALTPRLQSTQSTPAAETGNQARLQLIANIQRELTRKAFYDGPADGIWGSKTDAAVRDFLQAAGLKTNAEASDTLLRAITASNAKPLITVPTSSATSEPTRSRPDCCSATRARAWRSSTALPRESTRRTDTPCSPRTVRSATTTA